MIKLTCAQLRTGVTPAQAVRLCDLRRLSMLRAPHLVSCLRKLRQHRPLRRTVGAVPLGCREEPMANPVETRDAARLVSTRIRHREGERTSCSSSRANSNSTASCSERLRALARACAISWKSVSDDLCEGACRAYSLIGLSFGVVVHDTVDPIDRSLSVELFEHTIALFEAKDDALLDPAEFDRCSLASQARVPVVSLHV